MNLSAIDLKDYLNYDTTTQAFLSLPERCWLHKQIGRCLHGFSPELPSEELFEKLKAVKQAMQNSGWKPVDVRYDQARLPQIIT